jgi:hypothetical protein
MIPNQGYRQMQGNVMSNTAITNSIKKIISSQPIVIPVFHDVAIKLQNMIRDNSYRIEDVIILVNDDPALASEMLKHANGSYFCGNTPITSIRNAIVRLGSQQIVNLAFSASMTNTKSDNPVINTHLSNLWNHCHAVATTSAYLGLKISHDNKLPELNYDEVYLAGLLHDIGKLYLLKIIDRLIMTYIINPDNTMIIDIIDELNIDTGIKVMNHYKIPDIYTNLLGRLIGDNWKCGSNDYFVATVRLADKLHYYIENDIDITTSIETSDISDELSFLDINDVSDNYDIIKVIMD